jgi:ribosomal protein L14
MPFSSNGRTLLFQGKNTSSILVKGNIFEKKKLNLKTMVFVGTYCRVLDNSGVSMLKCLNVCNKKKSARVGDYIVACVVSMKAGSTSYTKMKLGQIVRAKVIDVKKPCKAKNGSKKYFCSEFTTSVILNALTGEFFGARSELSRLKIGYTANS